jgi:hypothetical protein
MSKKIKNRKWMTFVRDPIDHFLSGWAECEGRQGEKKSEKPYHFRVKTWLNKIKTKAPSICHCHIHSFPQATFLLDGNGKMYSQLELIGDLREFVGVLELVGFKYNNSLEGGRLSAENELIQKYYPHRKDLLSNDTVRAICEFVALDYFLFDFELPGVCKDLRVAV